MSKAVQGLYKSYSIFTISQLEYLFILSIHITQSNTNYQFNPVSGPKSWFSSSKPCITLPCWISVNSWPLTHSLRSKQRSTHCPTHQTFQCGRQVLQCHESQTLEFSVFQWLCFFLYFQVFFSLAQHADVAKSYTHSLIILSLYIRVLKR